MIKAARILSYLFHPLFMPLLSMVLILETDTSIFLVHPGVKALSYFIVVINTILIPLLFTLGMQRKGLINTVEMDTGRERRMPYLLYLLMLIVTWFFLRKARLPELCYDMLEGAAVAVGITLLVNLRWKISAHMVGFGGFCATVFAWTLISETAAVWPLSVALLLAGLLGMARVYLQAHDLLQIITGFLTGSLCVVLKVLASPGL